MSILESDISMKRISLSLGILGLAIALILSIGGCSVGLQAAGRVSDKAKIASTAYMAALKATQKKICTGDHLLVAAGRKVREADGIFLQFDCDRAQEAGSL